MTITFAAYAAPAGWGRPVVVAAVLALAAVNYFGVIRTAFLARIIVVVVLLVLAVVVAAGVSSGLPAAHLADASSLVGSDAYGILQSGVWVVGNGTGTSAKAWCAAVMRVVAQPSDSAVSAAQSKMGPRVRDRLISKKPS